jgi:hypothetical protein
MAQFTTRVELHFASEAHYEVLHREMARRGFSRTIRADTGETYHLPTAEYDCTADEPRPAVLAAAQAAAVQTGKSASILVTQSAGRTWSGLPKA